MHIVGKDILRFHAVYWPAFLLSAGIDAADAGLGARLAHGERPEDVEVARQLRSRPSRSSQAFGADALRYYLMRDIAFGQDGDFSLANLIARYNGELANGLGNLLNRVLASIVKQQFGGIVPAPEASARNAEDEALEAIALRSAKAAAEHLEAAAPQRALEAIWELVAAANRYVDHTEPWALAKRGETARLAQVVYRCSRRCASSA